MASAPGCGGATRTTRRSPGARPDLIHHAFCRKENPIERATSSHSGLGPSIPSTNGAHTEVQGLIQPFIESSPENLVVTRSSVREVAFPVHAVVIDPIPPAI